MPRRQLGVFAKHWTPGQVKTRLAAVIGTVPAAELYCAFLETTLRRLEQVSSARVVAFTPSDKRDDLAALAGPMWQLVPQSPGDLGQRMRYYFQEAVTAGFDRVLLVGSDTPTLRLGLVERAFEALNDHAVVLGPSSDGGYYVVGARDTVPDIFESIEWSTSHVWRQTIDRLEKTGISYWQLPEWYDVDDWDGLLRLRTDLATADDADPHLCDLRRMVEALIKR